VDRADSGDNEAALAGGEVGAVDVALTPEDLREIDDAASNITVQGVRYPESLARLTYR